MRENSPALLNEVRLFSNLNKTAARGTVIEQNITLNGIAVFGGDNVGKHARELSQDSPSSFLIRTSTPGVSLSAFANSSSLEPR